MTPICLLIDDPCPLVHVYREHWIDVHHHKPETSDGRPLLETIPNDFLDRFCDVMERWGIKGKFSVVPAPANRGDIVNGITGHDPQLTRGWIATVQRRLAPLCDFCPEGITHNLALHLRDGEVTACECDESESEWSQRQDRDRLIPYLTRSLALMREAGFDCTGVTSPWVFGTRVETEYVAAIVAAQRAVYGREFSWYFLHMLWKWPGTRPWVAYCQGPTTVVSIPANVEDHWWSTINSPRTDREYVAARADKLLTEDGQGGDIARVLDAGGWPILCTHWQSLFSNGLETGLAVLDELARRVDKALGRRVQWATCSDVAKVTVEELC